MFSAELSLRDDLFQGILKLQQNLVYFLYCHSYTTLLVLSKIWGGALAPSAPTYISTPLDEGFDSETQGVLL